MPNHKRNKFKLHHYPPSGIVATAMAERLSLIAVTDHNEISKAREFLVARGVSVDEIRQDEQGTRLFEMRDLEGNAIEISEEP